MDTPLNPDLDKQARRAAALKFGWIIHAAVFVLVNAGLWMAGHQRANWFGLPTGGWIIGLLIHGAVVWLHPLGQGLYQRLLQRERDRLGRR
jgi:2TM domain